MHLTRLGGILLLLLVSLSRSPSEFQITADEIDQQYPAIYKDIVVWEDSRNDNADIYGYNLSTKEELQITTDESDQYFPAIHGNIVVWEDTRNGNRDIYGYNLSTKEEFQITTDESDQYIKERWAFYCTFRT